MKTMVYDALEKYFDTLERTGYVPYKDGQKLLVYSFYSDFVSNNYDWVISCDDYKYIEKALNCLYDTSCLIPYPDYLKMGRRTVSSSDLSYRLAEMAQRIKNLEDTSVLQTVDTLDGDVTLTSDIIVSVEE